MEREWRFGGTSSGSKNKPSNETGRSWWQAQLNLLPASASFFLGLLFDPEGGGDKFF
jgi:hypothetical protein